MTIRNALLLVATALMATGCVSMEAPEVFLTNLTPLESTIFEQRVRLNLRIQNPNDVELAVRGLDFKLDINEIRFARGVSGEPFVVPALGEASTSVQASTTLLDLARQATTLVDETELRYGFVGRLHLDQGLFGRKLKFERTGTLAQLPSVVGDDADDSIWQVP